MKTYVFLISLFLIAILSFGNANAQKQDSLKQKQITKFYSKVLSAGHDTAKLVATIMNTYKLSAKKVIADPTLSEDARRIKIDELIADKNKKLSLLLSPAQQEKIIPTTERQRNKPGK